MKCMGSAWKESKELDVRAQAFQLISIFNWKLDRECIDGVTDSLIKDLKPPQPPGFNNRLTMSISTKKRSIAMRSLTSPPAVSSLAKPIASWRSGKTRISTPLSTIRLYRSTVVSPLSLPYDSNDASLIRVAHREYQKKIKVPPDHIARAIAQGSASYDAWTRARPANDFATMVPYLERTLDLSREYSSYFAPYKHVADPHIDGADKGITTTCATLVSCMKRLLKLSAKTLSPRAWKQKMPRFDPLGCDPSSRPQKT